MKPTPTSSRLTIRTSRHWAALYALLLSGAVTAPLAAPGYLLYRDAVSTPRSYLNDAALGLTEAAPRAVPQDFAIAAVTTVLDGGVFVKVLLALGLWLAGWGAARLVSTLVPAGGLAGQLVAATIAIWNPYVAERLLQGHWSLLVGYGCLPWVALSITELRRRPTGTHWCTLAFWIGLAGLTPTGTLLAATTGLAALTGPSRIPRRRLALGTLCLSVAAALPWLVVSGGGSGLPPTDIAGIHAFSARAEPGLGTLGTLASLGGIWNASAVPGSRTTGFAVAFSAVLLTLVAIGAVVSWRRRTARGMLVLSVAAIAIPALMATGPGLSFTTWVLTEVPALGIVRDGQKWVALAVPGYVVAGAGAVAALRGSGRRAVAAVAIAAALVTTLPDLAWGVGGRIRPVEYPAGWAQAAAQINAEPHPVAVLPPEALRQYPWGPKKTPVLDPLPRWIRSDTVTSGDLSVDGHEVLGDGTRGRAVERLLRAGARPGLLASYGIGWVVVQSDTPGDQGLSSRTLAQLQEVYRDRDIALYRVPGPWTNIGASTVSRVVAICAHLVWVALLLIGLYPVVIRVRRRLR